MKVLSFGYFALISALFAGTVQPARAAEKAVDKGRVSASEQVSFSVYLPLQNRDALDIEVAALHDSSSPRYHKWLSPDDFHARYAPSAAQMTAVRQQLGRLGLAVADDGAQSFTVTGQASAVEGALGVQLHHGAFGNGRKTVMAAGKPAVSGALAQAGAVVTGLSGFVRIQSFARKATLEPMNRYSPVGPYWVTDLKQAYEWPSYEAYNGKGSTIGILMSGDYNPSDIDLYFSHEKLDTPKIKTVNIHGGADFDPSGSLETHLDLQQSGGMAPKAKLILYNLPDLSDDSFIAGLKRIVEDNKVDVVSMSFGGAEIFYKPEYNDGTDYTYLLKQEDDLMAQGNAQGITFIASSGDSGALAAFPPACFTGVDNCGAALPSVNFPASSPHVVGVGGTNLITTHTNSTDLNSVYVREQAFANPLSADIFYGTSATGVYWGSGGGDSIIFRKPLFQALTNTGNARFRTVPDVSLQMGGCVGGSIVCSPDDSSTVVVINGTLYRVIGTSVSAPDFAGLAALAVERFGARLGNANYYVYALALTQQLGLTKKIFHQGIQGFNGLYYTTPTGYNRVLGNGTIYGKNFLLAPGVPSAGTPQTPSNP